MIEIHKLLDEYNSMFRNNKKIQNVRTFKTVRNLDRVAAALISFACIYVGLFITTDVGTYLALSHPWGTFSLPLVVSVLLISAPRLTNEIWKLWLVAFAANVFGVLILSLPLFYLIIHMHEV